MYQEIGESIVFDMGFVFHKSFLNTYRGMNTIQVRQKIKKYYTHGQQDVIIRVLKAKQVINQ